MPRHLGLHIFGDGVGSWSTLRPSGADREPERQTSDTSRKSAKVHEDMHLDDFATTSLSTALLRGKFESNTEDTEEGCLLPAPPELNNMPPVALRRPPLRQYFKFPCSL